MTGRRVPRSLAVFVAIGLAATLGWPLLATIREAIRYGDLTMAGGYSRPLDLAVETVRLVLLTEAIALPIGVVVALLLFRTDVAGGRFLLGLAVVGALLPMPLHAMGWLGAIGNVGRAQLLGGRPLLVGWSGAAFVHAMAALPWVVLLTGVGLRSVEPELEEAAWLEMPVWRVWLTVTIRRGIGGIAASALMVAVLTAGDMTVTDLLQVRTYAEEAYIQEALGQGPSAMAIVTVPPLIALGGAVLAGSWALLRLDPARLPSRSARARTWHLDRGRRIVGGLLLVLAGSLLALPMGGLLWRAGRVGGSAALGIGPSWSAGGLRESLAMAARTLVPYLLETTLHAAAGATVTVILAWGLAWLARGPGPWRAVAAVVVALSLACPAPVAGMGLMVAYRTLPFVYAEPTILVLAYAVRTLPYATAILWVGLRSLPDRYFEAAETEGMRPWLLVAGVAVPLSRGAIAAAWLVAFALALGELPATKLVAAPGMRNLSVFVWGLMHTGVDSHLAAVGVILILVFGSIGSAVALALGRLQHPTD